MWLTEWMSLLNVSTEQRIKSEIIIDNSDVKYMTIKQLCCVIFSGKRCITFCKGERHHIPHLVKIAINKEWILSLWILWHLNIAWLYRTRGSNWLWADETKHFENKHVTRWQSSPLAMQITCWFTYKRNGIDSIRWSGMKTP